MGKYVHFNKSGYTEALRSAIGKAVKGMSRDIYKAMVNNLAQLKVRKVDAKHAASFPRAIKITNDVAVNRFTSKVGMNNPAGNQSFRALYYEYGTGSNMRPPAKWNPSNETNNWNPARPKQAGAPIYYRDAPWYDLGGNYHAKPGVRRGVKKRIPQKNVYGHPVRAHFWFRDAVHKGTKNLDQLILQAVKSVPVTAYIKLRDIRVRM